MNTPCHSLSEDYRFTAALNILKHLVESYNAQPSSTLTPPSTSQTNLDTPVTHHADTSRPPSRVTSATPTKATPTKTTVPEEAVRLALRACEAYLSSREHNDIEESQLQLVYVRLSVCMSVAHTHYVNSFTCNAFPVSGAARFGMGRAHTTLLLPHLVSQFLMLVLLPSIPPSLPPSFPLLLSLPPSLTSPLTRLKVSLCSLSAVGMVSLPVLTSSWGEP